MTLRDFKGNQEIRRKTELLKFLPERISELYLLAGARKLTKKEKKEYKEIEAIARTMKKGKTRL